MKILILLTAALALFLSASGRERAQRSAHVGVIGGSDGPTAVFITRREAPAAEAEEVRTAPEGAADGAGAEIEMSGEE